MSTVLLIGNGLSRGFDPGFASDTLTTTALSRLPLPQAVLKEIAALGAPELDHSPIEAAGFEQLAGTLDRMAEALIVIGRLKLGTETMDSLEVAVSRLRSLYLRVVGAVLHEISDLCHPKVVGRERSKAWDKMHDFGGALFDVHLRAGPLAIYTLNYDSLLDAALLNTAKKSNLPRVYDGFRGGGGLNSPLDPGCALRLYHLHGSIGWIAVGEATIKRKLDWFRDQAVFEAWRLGDAFLGYPSVVLSDLKSPISSRYPFSVFYEDFGLSLAAAERVVVAGYGFGDVPVNRLLAQFLERPGVSLDVWSRTANSTQVIGRLSTHAAKGVSLKCEQIRSRAVELPNAEAIRDLLH